MPGGPQTARHCSVINDFSAEYAQSEAARIPDRQRLLVLCLVLDGGVLDHPVEEK